MKGFFSNKMKLNNSRHNKQMRVQQKSNTHIRSKKKGGFMAQANKLAEAHTHVCWECRGMATGSPTGSDQDVINLILTHTSGVV